jgi:hypothetical protein
MPPASMFDAPQLSVAQWMDAVVAYGGKYAVLTVQAGCGFDLWPSNVTLRGHKYNYTITESKYQRDLLREFVNEGAILLSSARRYVHGSTERGFLCFQSQPVPRASSPAYTTSSTTTRTSLA